MHGQMNYLFAGMMAFVIVYILTPLLKKWAVRLEFVDKPNERKIHKKPVPFTGGISMFIAFVVVYPIFTGTWDRESVGILVGASLIMSIGILDDWYKARGRDLSALPKLLVQLSAAVVVYQSGIVFHGFHNPFSNADVILPVWLQFLSTILWIFGVTTVVNFSDGMDGLAGGISCISASTLFIVALTKGQGGSAVMAVILIGATLGFLRFNRYPAKVFMGDAGATFLGFILSVIALDGVFKQATLLSLLIPVLALGIPIFDNIYVVIRRLMEKKPIYKADRSQVHFRLLSSGLNQRQVVAFLYLVSLCFALTSIILSMVTV